MTKIRCTNCGSIATVGFLERPQLVGLSENEINQIRKDFPFPKRKDKKMTHRFIPKGEDVKNTVTEVWLEFTQQTVYVKAKNKESGIHRTLLSIRQNGISLPGSANGTGIETDDSNKVRIIT